MSLILALSFEAVVETGAQLTVATFKAAKQAPKSFEVELEGLWGTSALRQR